MLETPIPGHDLTRRLARRGLLVGPSLGRWYPDLANCVLIAVTEKRTRGDIDRLVEGIEKELAEA